MGAKFKTWVMALCGAASVALAGQAAAAADLPLKAPPAAPAFNPFWAEADYLFWSVKGDHLPPLVTTSTPGAAVPGGLGDPATTVLFGNSSVNDDWRSGGRITAGYWFDPARSRGVEVSFFDLQGASTGFSANSGNTPILAQPFFNTLTGTQDAFLASFPGVFTGAIAATETSRLLGAGALYRQDLGVWGGERISALIGYRYLRSSDKLSMPLSVNSAVFGAISSTDSFDAASNFHGLDLGLAGEWQRDRWTLEWRTKVALGLNVNTAGINGTTTITPPGGTPGTFAGGVYALTSNIGDFSQTRFAVVPELSLKAGYEIAPQWRLFAGYDLLYWTGVQRAGGLIDQTINPNLIPPGTPGGPARPAPTFSTTPLLAQGFSFGVRYNY